MGIKNYITSRDGLTKPVYKMIHYDGGAHQNTFCGGFLTIFVKLVVLYIAVSEGIRLFTYSNP